MIFTLKQLYAIQETLSHNDLVVLVDYSYILNSTACYDFSFMLLPGKGIWWLDDWTQENAIMELSDGN